MEAPQASTRQRAGAIIALALIFLGETLSLFQVFGIALLIVGLLLVQIRGGSLSPLRERFRPAAHPLMLAETEVVEAEPPVKEERN